MVNTLKILDYSTLYEVGTISNIINPVVSETINDAYTLDFQTVYDDTTHVLSGGKIIELDDDYFQVMIMSKSTDLNYHITAEHISYRLNYYYYPEVEYEGTASEILTQMFEILDTGFTLGNIAPTNSAYFKASNTDSLRKRIIMVANLFGLEIIWNKFTVSLVVQRGENNNLTFELGRNLIGVTETYDLTEDIPEPTYEVDVLDLSHIEGYEDIVTVGLGDTVQVVADNINLNVSKRVIKRDYNPFSKANAHLEIGRVVRDFTDYFKDEEDEEDEEDERAKYLLEEFRIGNIDCLDLSGVEIDRDNLIQDGGSANIDFNEYEKLTGVNVRLKSQYSNYHITIYELYEDDYKTLDYTTSQSQLNTLKLPTEQINGIGVLVTEVPFSQFDADQHKFAQYGVKFNRTAIDVFREVRVGAENVLKAEGVALFPPINMPDDIVTEIAVEDGKSLTGLFVSMKQKYKDWYVKLTTYSKNGTTTEYNLADIEATAKTWVMPSSAISAISLTAMEKPPNEFNENEHQKQTIAFKFFEMEAVPEPYLTEFRLGDVDILSIAGVEYTDFNQTPTPILNYTKRKEFVGIQFTLNPKYINYHVTLIEYYQNVIDDWIDVSSEEITWGYPYDYAKDKTHGITLLVSEVPYRQLDINNHNYKAYGVQFIKVSPLITVNHKDEQGNILLTTEIPKTEIGNYDVYAEDIEGYEALEPTSVNVQITADNLTPTIEFIYKKTTTGTGYTLEFGSALLKDIVEFTFKNTNGYDVVESIVTGITGNLDANAIRFKVTTTKTNGKFTGIMVTSDSYSSADPISYVNIQAVCYTNNRG